MDTLYLDIEIRTRDSQECTAEPPPASQVAPTLELELWEL